MSDVMRRRRALRCRSRRSWLLMPLLVGGAACGDGGALSGRLRGNQDPVELPALLTTELPFRYPLALYVLGIPGDVTLQLFIDSIGLVVPDSVRVAEPSKYPAFDSSAVAGAPRLIFRPARRGERRIPYTVLFPVKFRVPGAQRPSGDSVGTGR
jgi:TonB family protein